ncbi:MAG: TIGR03643 family protein [Pseudomonadota bacterium]
MDKDVDIHEIIELAWDDRASFDDIEAQTGLKEKEVKRIMRDNMKPSSFRMWRKRVSGRATKHDHKLEKLRGIKAPKEIGTLDV